MGSVGMPNPKSAPAIAKLPLRSSLCLSLLGPNHPTQSTNKSHSGSLPLVVLIQGCMSAIKDTGMGLILV